MDRTRRQRGVYVTPRQKKKLIELLAKNPELISCKITQEFGYSDSQKLWQNIAKQCNTVPGARKTWKQWRKTWQDLRSKYKKRVKTNSPLPLWAVMLTPAEKDALGIKDVDTSPTDYQETLEFVPLDQDTTIEDNFNDEEEVVASYSETESLPEVKVFERKKSHKSKLKNNSSKHSNNCYFNCDLLAASEERKLQIKEDYFNFKKDYLRQKLKVIKEQTEALKIIAKELAK